MLIIAGCAALVASADAVVGSVGSVVSVVEPTHAQLMAQTEELEKLLPLFERLGLSSYERSSDCTDLEEGRGIFTNSRDGSCVLHPDLARPFDAPAAADLAELNAAFSSTGLDIASAWTTDDPHAAPGWAFFGHRTFCTWLTYVHEPGFAVLPADSPGHAHYTRVSDDWFVWEGPG